LAKLAARSARRATVRQRPGDYAALFNLGAQQSATLAITPSTAQTATQALVQPQNQAEVSL